MTLYFEEEGSLKLPLECEQIARQIIPSAFDYLGCPYEIELNLLLTMNDQICELNSQFRGIDRPTDVLSFPLVDYENPGDFTFLEHAEEYFNPESGELCIGDIVISKERVLAQAEEYGHSILREYAFLIVHSVLHLAGYDHIDDSDRVEMERLQNEIMKKLNILR